MNGFGGCVRVQLALLRRRRLPRWVAGAALASVLLTALWSTREDGGGWRLVAASGRLLAAVLIGLTAVQGAVAVAGDASQGSLRAVMMRPVARRAIILSHAVVLMLFTLLVYAGGLVLALLLGQVLCGYGDVMRHEFVVMHEEEMRIFAVRLLLLPIPALLVAPVLSLALSVLAEDAATAVVFALVAAVGPLLFELVAGELPLWIFTERAMHPVTVLAQLAEGIQLQADRVETASYLWGAIWQPAAWLVAVGTAAVLLFGRREVLT